MSDSSAVSAITAAPAEPTTTSTYTDHPASPVSTKKQTDSVTLSSTAQATLLSQEGFSTDEIAQVLSLPVSTVQADLGIAIASTQTKAVGA